jgi:hypothetical protein
MEVQKENFILYRILYSCDFLSKPQRIQRKIKGTRIFTFPPPLFPFATGKFCGNYLGTPAFHHQPVRKLSTTFLNTHYEYAAYKAAHNEYIVEDGSFYCSFWTIIGSTPRNILQGDKGGAFL